jgi:phosphoribosylformimino-5-aminoimidazole carboxamide ribonucleotide (ProFAR) isomerase
LIATSVEFISTTATAAEKLKRLAKTVRKTTVTSVAVALDVVAKQHDHEHWMSTPI